MATNADPITQPPAVSTVPMLLCPRCRPYMCMLIRSATNVKGHLLNVPPEIRWIIYSYLAEELRSQEFEVRSNNSLCQRTKRHTAGALTRLGQTCEQIHLEVQDFLRSFQYTTASITISHRPALPILMTGLWRQINCSRGLFLRARSINLQIDLSGDLSREQDRALDLLHIIRNLITMLKLSRRLQNFHLQLRGVYPLHQWETRSLDEAEAMANG